MPPKGEKGPRVQDNIQKWRTKKKSNKQKNSTSTLLSQAQQYLLLLGLSLNSLHQASSAGF